VRKRAIPTSAVALTCALALPAAAQAQQADASKRRSCGTISSTSTYPYARVVAIRGVSCWTAGRVAKRYDSRGTTPRGWFCALAHDDRPRLFSCGSGGGSGDLRTWPRSLEAIGTQRRGTPLRCGSVSYGGRTFVMFHRGIVCATARRYVRRVHRNRRLAGWNCSSGSNYRTGGSCQQGRKLFGWHPAD
jgi:hypothetical protein